MLKNLHDPKIDEKWSHAFPNYNYYIAHVKIAPS